MSEVIKILVGPLGVVILLAVFMYCFIKEWFVTGPRYREMQADRDMWRERTLRSFNLAERTVGAVERVVEEHETVLGKEKGKEEQNEPRNS